MIVRPLVLCVAVVALCGCKKKLEASTLELSETFRAPTGSAILSFPSSMTAKIEKSGVIGLRPKKDSAFDPYDAVIVTDHPRLRPELTSIDAYATFLHEEHESGLKKWMQTSRASGTCLGRYPGIEIAATFDEDDGTPARYWSCAFVADGHGFKVAFTTRDSAFESDGPSLRKIADAVRVTP